MYLLISDVDFFLSIKVGICVFLRRLGAQTVGRYRELVSRHQTMFTNLGIPVLELTAALASLVQRPARARSAF